MVTTYTLVSFRHSNKPGINYNSFKIEEFTDF